jgi:hypothetical protein
MARTQAVASAAEIRAMPRMILSKRDSKILFMVRGPFGFTFQ